MFRIAVCDDDSQYREMFIETLKGHLVSMEQVSSEFDVVQYATSTEIIERCISDEIDVVFMDIELGDESGFDVVRTLMQIKDTLLVAYMTSHSHYVYQAFVCRPMGFIRKSNITEDLMPTLANICDEWGKRNIKLNILYQGNQVDIFIQKLQVVEVINHHMQLVLDTDTLSIRYSLSKIEQVLKENHFIKVRKGIMVNPTYIKEIRDDEIILLNNTSYAISRNRVKEVKYEWMLSRIT